MLRLLPLLLLAVALAGCRSARRVKPASSSKAGEVLVVGDESGLLSACLSRSVPGLPQEEPLFDVRRITAEQLSGNALLARAIVVVGRGGYKVGRDLDARPQLVVRAQLSDSVRVLRDLLAFEESVALAQLRRHPNAEMEARVRRQFGVDMTIPEEMKASKTGRDFLWMATNGAENVRGLCVMRLRNAEGERLPVAVDSALAHNIRGERASVRMHLLLPAVEKTVDEGRTVLRGQWEMDGDAMGGAFVASAGHTSGETIVLLAFAYAPERKKRNIMRQLQAVVLNDNITYGQ